ncbi:hypothetical protein [Limnobacter sp.]|uniref:hypothetical protein n=1 Tax=Limnobacter sp. TaxID=2003368 RepID=UPI002FE23ACA
MHTKKLLLGGAVLLAVMNSHAQNTATPALPETTTAKVENKTAVTPVENINLNGISVPLNIKTLAEIQRLQEEKAMREELITALKDSGKAAPSAASKPQSTVVPVKIASTNPSRTSKPATAISPNTLLGVYGTAGAMTAEIQTAGRNVRTLREGEQLGKFNVRRISNSGLELVASNGNTQHVSVGAQVRF